MAPNRLSARSAASTRLTLSKNSAQSKVAIVRMAVITLRTVTFIAAWSWCSTRTSSSGDVPSAESCSSSHRSAGVVCGILLAQALDELHGEGDGQGGGLEGLEGQGAGRSPAEPEQLVGQRVGVMAGRASLHDPLGQAPEVLHQHHAQGDGDGPELADGQRLRALERAHEAAGGSRARSGCRCGRRRPRPGRGRGDSRAGGRRQAWEAGGRTRRGRSAWIDRSVSSTTWKLSRNHSAAGVRAPSSPITAAIVR